MSDTETHDFDAIKRTRDEIRLQLHLARAELLEEWEHAETRFNRLEGEVQRLRETAAPPAKELKHAVTELAKDVGETYGRILDALRRPA